jgi:hypothetical protein
LADVSLTSNIKIWLFCVLSKVLYIWRSLDYMGGLFKYLFNFPTTQNFILWRSKIQNGEIFLSRIESSRDFYWPFSVLSSPSRYVRVQHNTFFLSFSIFIQMPWKKLCSLLYIFTQRSGWLRAYYTRDFHSVRQLSGHFN